jgi:hypothetical protein
MLTRFPARTKIQIYLKPRRALSLPYLILSSPMRSCTWSFTEYSTMNRGYATRCSPDLATTSASVFFWPCAPSSAGALREENGPVLHMCCQMSSLWDSYYPHFAVARHSYSLVKVQCRHPLSPPSRRAFRTLTHCKNIPVLLEAHSHYTPELQSLVASKLYVMSQLAARMYTAPEVIVGMWVHVESSLQWR